MQKKQKMHVKNNDYVIVISGKHKGLKGKIIKAINKESKVVIEGINIYKKHVKPRNENQSGEIVSFEAPIHSSNVKIYSIDKQ